MSSSNPNGANPNANIPAGGKPQGVNNYDWAGNRAKQAGYDPATGGPSPRVGTGEIYVDPNLPPRDAIGSLEAQIESAAGGLKADIRDRFRREYIRPVDIALGAADVQVVRTILGTAGCYAKSASDMRAVIPDGAGVARFMATQQRSILAQAISDATSALKDLRPAILKSGCPSRPDGVTEADARDQRDQLAGAIEAAGDSTASRSAAAQKLIYAAVKNKDGLTLYALLTIFDLKAQSLGLNIDTLRKVYMTAKYAEEGDHPLMISTPGARLVATCWTAMDDLIKQVNTYVDQVLTDVEAAIERSGVK